MFGKQRKQIAEGIASLKQAFHNRAVSGRKADELNGEQHPGLAFRYVGQWSSCAPKTIRVFD